MGRGESIDWSPVWSEVVKLHNENMTLSQIRSELQKSHPKFEASIRAYRSRFKERDMTRLIHMNRQTLLGSSGPRLGIAELQDTQDPANELSVMPIPLTVNSITTDLDHASKRRRLDFHLEQHERGSQSQSPYIWSGAQRVDIVARTTKDGVAGLASSSWGASQSNGRPRSNLIDAALALGTNAGILQRSNLEETPSEESNLAVDHFSGQQHEVQYSLLEPNAHKLQDILLATKFEPEITNVLHRAAAKYSTILGPVLQFMRQRNISIDLLDEEGRTALHLAIKNGHNESVRSLLDTGASINRQGSTTALHVAVEAAELSEPIINVLLDHGAKTYAIDYAGSSSLRLLVNRLGRQGLDGKYETLKCILDAITALLNKGSTLDSEQDKPTFEAFIDWFQPLWLASSLRWYYRDYALPVLRTFLAKGYSPLHDVTVRSCPYEYCDTLADFAAFHLPDDELWRLIARSSSIDTHVLSLARRLLEPCFHCNRAFSPAKYMEMLPWHGAHFTAEDSTNLLHELLDQTYTHNSGDNHTILQMWLDRGFVTDVQPLKHQQRPLEAYLMHCLEYANVPHLGLVTTLLSVDKGLSIARETQVDDMADSLFCYHPGLHYRKYMEPDYGCHLLQYYFASIDSLDPKEFYSLLKDSWRCVIHVLTAHLIADDLAIPHAENRWQRTLFAAVIRKEAKLPLIAVGHDILIEAIGSAPESAGYVTAYEGSWDSLKASLRELPQLHDFPLDEDEDEDEDEDPPWT
ncbi:hypothetical protein LTR78_000603 [Recurvomyces mirabilis]|uniref:Clr5 domain-containing protein n=1 Tax=Recurvomyces mirabilis TaxID=574656 RepID=A0AAE1C6L5_9PEZI|nr:hypothetical protein LTR78_000603 [Recurvomyces mirabilis]KAK5162257.1 hypothetical protein LTS14_000604 [Recurvomyces mirabilis]